MKQKILRTLWYAYVIATGFFCGLLLMALLSSCRSVCARSERAYTARSDTVVIIKTARDTLLHRDSIYIHEYQRGDTVFITQFRDRLRYSVALSRDTVFRSRADTLRDTIVVASPPATTSRRGRAKPIILVAAWVLLVAIAGGMAWRLHRLRH